MQARTQTGIIGVAIAGLLTGVLLILAGGGYYAYRKDRAATKEASTAILPVQEKPKAAPAQTPAPKPEEKYLVIKELGVKLPIDEAEGWYYVMQKTTGKVARASIFSKRIDALNNSEGKNCKDPAYPLFIISRAKTTDVPKDMATTTDPEFMFDPGEFRSFDFDKNYTYSGIPAHQSAPLCAGKKNNQPDQAVLQQYKANKESIMQSFERMSAHQSGPVVGD